MPYRYGKVDSTQKVIVDGLRACGVSVWILNDTIDLIVGYHGRNYLLEVKSPGGQLTQPQKDFIPTWEGQVAVVTTLAEALKAVNINAEPLFATARKVAQTTK